MNKIKDWFIGIGLFVVAIFALIRYFVAPKKDEGAFPAGDDKKAAENAVEETKKEIAKVEEKQFSDEEIEKKFND